VRNFGVDIGGGGGACEACSATLNLGNKPEFALGLLEIPGK
jgi:hypothetical protein